MSAETDECILWPFYKDRKGYGQLRIEGRAVLAHNEVARRALPLVEGKPFALHDPLQCNNPSCINKRHLRWGDFADNAADKTKAGSLHGVASKLSDRDLQDIRQSPEPASTIAFRYGVSKQYISNIRHGRTRR